jgi:hypothetical protein
VLFLPDLSATSIENLVNSLMLGYEPVF